MPLVVRTVQTGTLRTLFDALKEMFNDVNITFTSTGMKVVSMDSSHVVLMDLILEAKNFDYYECSRSYTVGLNMPDLYKILKIIDNTDQIGFLLDDEDLDKLTVESTNTETGHETRMKLKLLDIDQEHLEIPDKVFNTMVPISSVEFQRIVRDLNTLAETVVIKTSPEFLVFEFCGDLHEGYRKIPVTCEQEYSEEFSLTWLSRFSKASNLCSTVEILLEESFPLFVKYEVGSLGTIVFCLAPQIRDDMES